MTSEEKLGFTKPAEHQCPNIDVYIKYAKEVASAIYEASNCSYIEDIQSNVSDAAWRCDDIEGYFEEVREALESVREWGQSWKDQAKYLIEKYEPELLGGGNLSENSKGAGE